MVDFAENDISQSGVDARIGPSDSVVQSVLDAVHATAGDDEVVGGDPDGPGAVAAPPLYDFVNPDALESLYAHARDHQGTAAWTTTFRYADADVSVTSAGTVTVEPVDADETETEERAHDCPNCEDADVDVSDDQFVVSATLQCPECGHEWEISF